MGRRRSSTTRRRLPRSTTTTTTRERERERETGLRFLFRREWLSRGSDSRATLLDSSALPARTFGAWSESALFPDFVSRHGPLKNPTWSSQRGSQRSLTNGLKIQKPSQRRGKSGSRLPRRSGVESDHSRRGQRETGSPLASSFRESARPSPLSESPIQTYLCVF